MMQASAGAGVTEPRGAQALERSMTGDAGLRVALGLLLVAHLALTVAYSIVAPLGEAPDEADHWSYIVYLFQERRLPEGPAMTQAKHPPFYHATAAVVASLIEPQLDFMRANPDVQITPASWGEHGGPNFFIHTALEDWPWQGGPLAFHLARLWSAVLSTLTVWASFGLMRVAFPGRPGLALGSAGLLAFLPEFAFIGGSANNDNAAALFGALALLGGIIIFRERGRLRHAWWTPLALGLGFWAKVSTVALWPVVAAAILAGLWADETATHRPMSHLLRRVLPRLLTTGLLVFLPALLLAAPWLWRNWSLYGDPLGMELARQTVDVRAGPWTTADTAWLLRGWFISFWGKFGGAGHIPMPGWLYGILAALTALAGLGLARAIARIRAGGERLAIGLLVLAVALTAAGIWRYSLMALGTDQGRLLYPAVGALAGLLALGWLAWLPRRWEAHGAIVLALLSLALGWSALCGVVRPAFAPPPPAALPVQDFEPVEFGELTLIGAELGSEPVLYWTVAERPAHDWRVILRVVAVDGALVWEWKRSPGAGRWSTDRWPAGYVMRDVYRVAWPEWAGPGRYRVEAGAYPYAGEIVGPARRGDPPASPQQPYYFVGWLER